MAMCDYVRELLHGLPQGALRSTPGGQFVDVVPSVNAGGHNGGNGTRWCHDGRDVLWVDLAAGARAAAGSRAVAARSAVSPAGEVAEEAVGARVDSADSAGLRDPWGHRLAGMVPGEASGRL